MESVDPKSRTSLATTAWSERSFPSWITFSPLYQRQKTRRRPCSELTARARELYQKTEDEAFTDTAQEELKTQFNDILTVSKVSAL